MTALRQALLPLLAIILTAIPEAAQTQTRGFDGAYAGVSREREGGGMQSGSVGEAGKGCPPSGRAAALSIANGVARTPWGPDNMLEGAVTPQGGLVMRAPNGARFDGQIDPQGRITGRITGFCAYQMVWQKRGR